MTIADLTFSLIVNTTDRARPLQTLLRSLEQQSYPHFEVIVVVGPTRDNTLEVLSEYGSRVRVLRCDRANLSQSRNVGLLAARGDVVAFVDDDAVPARRWLEQLARLFQDPNLDATGGSVYLIHPDQPAIQHRLGIISSLAEQIDVQSSWLDNIVPPGVGSQWVGRMMGTNMAFRRQALLDIGGFDQLFEWVFDDADVALRLAQGGRIVQPVKGATVYHIPASSRRRVAFSYNVKWWVQTKAAVYMAIKAGRSAGDPASLIAGRCRELVRNHWHWSGELWRAGRLTFAQFLRMRALEVGSGIEGASRALLPRQVFSGEMLQLCATPARAGDCDPTRVVPFLDENSARQPVVDPISGRQPPISLPEPPLRICLLSSAYPPNQYEGVGRLTNLMARGLFELGHTVHVITRGEEQRVAFYDGAYVHHIPYQLDRYSRYRAFPRLYHSLNYCHAVYDQVRRLILNDGIQIVDSPLWQFDGLVTAVSGVAPVVVRLVTALRQISALHHDDDPDAQLIGEMERLLLEQAAHLLPNTRATLDAAARVYGLATEGDRVTIVPYGIVPAAEDQVRLLDLAALPETFTVLFVGRLEKRKGIGDLFEAIPRVLEEVSNVRFIIAGSDNSRHDGFQQQTEMDYPTYFACRHPGALGRVQFLGFVSDEQLQDLYRFCDLFVAPSLYESFGLIYLEAMNYAKPVVGCCAGGVPEVVDHGTTGLLVEPEAPAALAEAIVSLLKSPARLSEMGRAGRQQLLDRFTYLQMAENFARVYRRVIQAHHSTLPPTSLCLEAWGE